MKQKIIFLDIDGTFTEPGSNLPPATACQAVKKAKEAGHLVFLCTGRSYGMMSDLLAYGFDGVVPVPEPISWREKKVIYDCPLTEKQKNSAMQVLKENGIFRTLECRDGAYTDEGVREFPAEMCKKRRGEANFFAGESRLKKSMNIHPMSEYRNQAAYKMVVMSPSAEALIRSQEALKDDFHICIQDSGRKEYVNGEVMNRKINKGMAVEYVCSYFHIPLEDSVGFGDSMNDKEMLEKTGLGICMENGSETVKAVADDICPSVTEDGIWKAFQKHHLI